MPTLRLRRTLGLKLGLAFAGVLAVMLGSLGPRPREVRPTPSQAYEHAIAWKDAIDGASNQAAGTRQQQAVAGALRRHRRRALQGRVGGGRRDRRAQRRRGREAQRPDRHRASPRARPRPTASTTPPSHEKLFPAMERGDTAAAHDALLLADRYVRVPLKAQEEIERLRQPAPGGGHRRRQGRVRLRAPLRAARRAARHAARRRHRLPRQPRHPPLRQRTCSTA